MAYEDKVGKAHLLASVDEGRRLQEADNVAPTAVADVDVATYAAALNLDAAEILADVADGVENGAG